jgi:hypothetical protein
MPSGCCCGGYHSPYCLDIASTPTKDSPFIFAFKGDANPNP